jgi:hypothetical protein
MNSIPISETITLSAAGVDEAWLQQQIWDNPSCLGLGELEGVTKERAVSSGGRLDLLLKNPVDDSMYEVETMLGDTNPDHIVRTIEYWDLVKRKWPQRQHYAVLVAERITKRFFNVIQILSGAVPLVAIQVNVVKSPHGQSLHFTKILDVYEEPDDETSTDTGTYDEAYWLSRSKSAVEVAHYLLNLTQELYSRPELRFNKTSIVITSAGYNQLTIQRRAGTTTFVTFRYGPKREEILALLEQSGVQYAEHHHRFSIQMPAAQFKAHNELFAEIARLNKEWWIA